MKTALALLAAATLAAPALAQSELSLVDYGRLFCAAIIAGDDAPIRPLLTPELADLLVGREVTWHSGAAAPVQCMPVGASGSYDNPESVLALNFANGKSGSDRLVLAFVDGQLRLDDVKFADGGTLRERLTTN